MISTEKESAEIRLPQARHAIGFFISLFLALFLAQLVIVVLLLFILSLVTGASDIEKEIQQTDAQVLFVSEAIFGAVIILGVIWLFLRFGRFDWRATLSLHPCRRLGLYLWAAVTVLALNIWVSQLLTYVMQAAPWLVSQSVINMARVAAFSEPGAYALLALAITLGPAVSEELAFRGFILRGFLSRFHPAWAILFTALLFAILHIEPLQVIAVFPFGLLAGYLVVRTNSIYPAMLMHACIDLASTVEGALFSLYFPDAYRSESALREFILNWSYPPIVFVVAVFVLPLGLYTLHRLTRPQAPRTSEISPI